MTDPAESAAANSSTGRITMFGAQWCGDCRRSKALLDRLGVDFDYVDLELQPDAADAAQQISGRTRIPVIVFPDESHVVEPTDAELHAKLVALGTVE